MEFSLKQIADLVEGTLIGDGSLRIKGVSGLREAGRGEIAFLANPKYLPFVEESQAAAVLIGPKDPIPDKKPVIVCRHPSLAFSRVVEQFYPIRRRFQSGVNSTAVVGKDVVLGKDVCIGPCVVLEDGVSIGEGSILGAGSFVGAGARIGQDALIYPNVTIREAVQIGSRVIIHSGTVIGSDGFGYETVEGVHYKIPQVGIVVVGDDVEIGSNVCVDRARFGKTVIGRGTKIDNLVQIAHNVEIGEHSIVVAQVGISGTTKIGHHVTLAGQVGVVGHIEVGDGAIVAAQAGVSNTLAGGVVYGGTPAVPLQDWKKNVAYVQRLGKLVERVRELEKRVRVLPGGAP